MPYQSTVILQALAPGVALTSMIFYYGNLQQRLIFTVNTIRNLNTEARQLREEGKGQSSPRLENLRWQVEFLTRRFKNIHTAILFVYAGFFSSILTILSLLFMGFTPLASFTLIPYLTFAAGFVCMGAATLVSVRELALSHRTILADIESTYPDEGAVIRMDRFGSKQLAS